MNVLFSIVLCCVVAVLACIKHMFFFFPTKMYMLRSPLLLPRWKQLESQNWGISDFCEFKTTGNSEKKWTLTGKISFERSSSGLFLELRPEDDLRHGSTLFFFQVPSCLESTINPENARLWWHHFPTKARRSNFLFKWAQHNKVSKNCIACCCINDVICQVDMYNVAKKVMLSVCFCSKLLVAHVPHPYHFVPFPLLT